jgi:hypothetical protein
MTLTVHLDGLGLLGPGLTGWPQAAQVLAQGRWQWSDVPMPAPQRLPAAERRRAGAVVKLSIAVADQACTEAGIDPLHLATVFSSSSGDGNNCHTLCETLASAERLVSPTRFTNSVHNAPAGYWHIATHSRAPSTSLCAHDASFAAGLLEAAAEALSWQRPVLLVAADVPYPEPLQGVRPLLASFGVAMVLSPQCTAHSFAALTLSLPGARATALRCAKDALEALRLGVPAARALPLLQALAGNAPSQVVLEHLPQCALQVDVQPLGVPAAA